MAECFGPFKIGVTDNNGRQLHDGLIEACGSKMSPDVFTVIEQTTGSTYCLYDLAAIRKPVANENGVTITTLSSAYATALKALIYGKKEGACADYQQQNADGSIESGIVCIKKPEGTITSLKCSNKD